MVWTATELLRIEAIEERVNNLQTALNNLPTKTQMKALLNIRQTEITALQTDLAALTQRVVNLENA